MDICNDGAASMVGKMKGAVSRMKQTGRKHHEQPLRDPSALRRTPQIGVEFGQSLTYCVKIKFALSSLFSQAVKPFSK